MTTNLEDLNKGDKVLFNDRAQPLEVEEVEDEKVIVAGPKGGKYEIYLDGDTLLVCKEGNRRYSSYCEDLRKVGEWIKEENIWKHSKSGAEIKLKQNENGFWFVESDEFEPDNPKYGFSQKEFAVEEAESIVDKHPDGLK